MLCLVSWSHAQVDRAALVGTVTDSSGRVLPQAHVTAVQNSHGTAARNDIFFQRNL